MGEAKKHFDPFEEIAFEVPGFLSGGDDFAEALDAMGTALPEIAQEGEELPHLPEFNRALVSSLGDIFPKN